MSDDKNPQDLTPTFLRKLPDGKTEQVDANGKPMKASKPADDKPAEDKRTVAQLTDALKAKNVELPDGAKRDDLVKLAADHGA